MNQSKWHILLTGAAGFIGSHVADALLAAGFRVTGIDNFDPFYSRSIKEANLSQAKLNPNFTFHELDITDHDLLESTLTDRYDAIIHLAAKAGVRPSIEQPVAYQQTNVTGTQHLLEFARAHGISRFVFASSSSVYGINQQVPWQESDSMLHPISPYASTKISGELMGHVYSHLFGIRFIALRFFTVFGPRQRPDLAIHAFSKKMMNQQPIQMFGDGSTRRDYTYVADIVQGVLQALHYDRTSFEIFNLGNCRTISLQEMIESLEDVFQVKAIIERKPEQPGDVPQTFADIEKAVRLLGYQPSTSFRDGLIQFKNWFTNQYNLHD
jgi:UDP-glucuronate 4-epimerase